MEKDGRKQLTKQMTMIMIGTSLIAFALGSFLVPNWITYGKGILFGTLFSILKLYTMEKNLIKTLQKNPEQAKSYFITNYMIRYVLTGVVLLVGALESSISFLGVCIGLISMKVAAYLIVYGFPTIGQK